MEPALVVTLLERREEEPMGQVRNSYLGKKLNLPGAAGDKEGLGAGGPEAGGEAAGAGAGGWG